MNGLTILSHPADIYPNNHYFPPDVGENSLEGVESEIRRLQREIHDRFVF